MSMDPEAQAADRGMKRQRSAEAEAALAADEEEAWFDDDGEFDHRYYNAQTVFSPEEAPSPEERIAHDVLQSFISAGAVVEDPSHCEQIFHCFHAEWLSCQSDCACRSLCR